MATVHNGTIRIDNKENRELNTDNLQDQLKDLQETFRKFTVAYFEQFAGITKPIIGIQKLLSELSTDFQITDKEAYRVLRKYKWIISPSMSIEFVVDAIKIGMKKGNQRGKIDRMFIDYYLDEDCAAIIEMSHVWNKNKIIKPRMKIINDCIKLLKSHQPSINPSNIIIPTLLSQIDGILSDFTRQKGIKRNEKSWKAEFRKMVKNEQLLEYSMELANDLLLEYLFQTSIPGKPLGFPFSFNRHKIVHGEQIKYGRIDNAIRSLLIIDYLAYCE
jgi:hypothetical protein